MVASNVSSDEKKSSILPDEKDVALGQIDIISDVSPEIREAEAKIVRKFDYRVLPLLMLLQMIAFLDRSNVGAIIYLIGESNNGRLVMPKSLVIPPT